MGLWRLRQLRTTLLDTTGCLDRTLVRSRGNLRLEQDVNETDKGTQRRPCLLGNELAKLEVELAAELSKARRIGASYFTERARFVVTIRVV